MKYLKKFNENLDQVRKPLQAVSRVFQSNSSDSPQDQIRKACKRGDLETFKRLHEEFGDSINFTTFLGFAATSGNYDLVDYIVDNDLVDNVFMDMRWISAYPNNTYKEIIEKLKMIQSYIDSGEITPVEDYKYSIGYGNSFSNYSDMINEYGSLFNFIISKYRKHIESGLSKEGFSKVEIEDMLKADSQMKLTFPPKSKN